MYAQSGFRTVEDWTARGRTVDSGAIPRVDAAHHGIASALFSHDQTHLHRKLPPANA
jgi:hypothetical protein